MAQSVQIVPKYSFSHVETYVNDYTVYQDETIDSSTNSQKVNLLAVFTSDEGEDNVFIPKENRADFRNSYGKSNYALHGQALMTPIAELATGYATVWCMRVMPDNATYANATINAWYKADTADKVADASNRKFRLKFTSKYIEDIRTKKAFIDACNSLDGDAVAGVYKDAEGFTQAPVLAVRTAGRGKYGNKDAFRIVRNNSYEKDYGIKLFTFEFLNSKEGVKKTASYVGSVTNEIKYDASTFINDVLDEASAGTLPDIVYAYEENIHDVYESYVKFVEELLPELKGELTSKSTQYAIPEDMMNGLTPVSEQYKTQYNELKKIMSLIEAASNIPDESEFDLFFGYKVASTTEMIPFIDYCVASTGAAGEADNPSVTKTEIIDIDDPFGIPLNGGTDGDFDKLPVGKTREDVIDECFIKAFNGTYDRTILSSKRIPVDVLFDANYSMEVKEVLYNLAKIRNSCPLYLDCGIMESLDYDALNKLIEKYSIFDPGESAVDTVTSLPIVSKNIQHYYVKDMDTKKRVPVTITYFLAMMYPQHIINNGIETPFVKSNCELSGHIKDSLYPPVDDYESALKEKLYDNNFNYFETVGENRFQRGSQNMNINYNSDLLEESNARIVYTLKEQIEEYLSDKLYTYTSSTDRNNMIRLLEAQYQDWHSKMVNSINFDFGVTEYEGKRSIIHLYVSIQFRNLNKRTIVEIDINPRDYTA